MCAVPQCRWVVQQESGGEREVVFERFARAAPGLAGAGEKIEVRPASGNAPTAPAMAPGGAAAGPATAAGARPNAKSEGVFGEKWQRLQFLQNRGVAEARVGLQNLMTNCDAEQEALSRSKASAANNLAGATYMRAISSEMQARATICDAKIRDARFHLERLEKETADLQRVVR